MPAAAHARRRAVDPAALRDLRHDRRAPRAVRRRGRGARCATTAHARLARARPRSRACSTPAPRPAALRCALLGGGPMPRALLERARGRGRAGRPTYGLTEACSQVTVAEPGDLETAGRALPGVGVRSPTTARSSSRAPTVTALGGVCAPATSAGSTSDGRLHRHRPQGRHDRHAAARTSRRPRSRRCCSSTRRSPRPAVFGRPHPQWGEAVTALVVAAHAGAELDEARCARTAASGSRRFKVPKAFELVDELPRTASGKLRRADCASVRRSWPTPTTSARRAASAGARRRRAGRRAATRCAPARCPSRPG